MLSEQVVGRGQVNPGPSRFALPVSRILLTTGALLIAAIAASSRFLFSTLLVGRSDDRAVAAITALILGLTLIAVARRSAARNLPRGEGLTALLSGALLACVPLLVALNRHSDAPAGTVVVFWTAVVPAILFFAVGIRATRRDRAVVTSQAVLLGVGAAGILGNWERPSSLTLLTRYVPEQLYLGLASVLLVAGVLVLARIVARRGWPSVAGYAGIGSLAVGAIVGLTAGDPASLMRTLQLPNALAYAISTATLVLLAVTVSSRGKVFIAAAGLALVPVTLSLLVFVEAAVGVYGPEPILRTPVTWGSILVGVVIVALARAEAHGAALPPALMSGIPTTIWSRVAIAVAAVALVAALAGMVLPGVAVSVDGRLADASTFSAGFQMRGYETVGGWMALATAALALALVGHARSVRVWIFSVIVVVVAAAAWHVLGFIPLHTWVSWIPADVQQDYGTEYARIVFEPLPVIWQRIAVFGAVISSLLWAAQGLLKMGRYGFKDGDAKGSGGA